MAKFPWKKIKAAAEAEEEPKEYARGEDKAANTLSDRSHIEDNTFKSAMASLGFSTEVSRPESPAEMSTGPDPSTMIQNTDGYWYHRKPDGSYDPRPWIRNQHGSFQPYQ